MAQNIKLNIAGSEYALVAKDATMESYMRVAAQSINKMLADYNQKYPTKSLQDKLAFVALNETVSMLSAQTNYKNLKAEVEELEQQLAAYLEKAPNR